MQIETYEIEEINSSEASTMAADSEAIELIEKLGLSGQKKLSSPDTATRFPYPRMSASQTVVFSALFPTKTDASHYDQGIIPLRVLQVMAFCKDLPQTQHLKIWHAASVKEDPILVGAPTDYSGDLYLLARWGDALPSFDELKAKALGIIENNLRLELKKAQQKLAGHEASISEIAKVYAETGEKPSWNIWD